MPIKKSTKSKAPTWEIRLNGYFKGFCRKVFKYSPAYKATLKRTFTRKEGKTEYYRCEGCGREIPRPQKRVDHIKPVVDPETGWHGDWNELKKRMSFDDPSNLQLLCHKPCHVSKTNGENKIRRIRRIDNAS